MVALSLVIVANGMLYWVLGPGRTLDFLARIFGTTHPTLPDGRPDLPPIDVLKAAYVEHPLRIGLHYVFMPLVLLVALAQFSPRLRARRPALHRWLGRAFFLCFALGLGGAVLKIATGDVYGGTLSRVQFTGMALTTILCGAMGGRAALRRDFAAHERWMWRTYMVLWSSAVVSRVAILVVVPVLWRWMGGRAEDYPVPYNAVLAASWSLPLLLGKRRGPDLSTRASVSRSVPW
jgi:hypothetical protein